MIPFSVEDLKGFLRITDTNNVPRNYLIVDVIQSGRGEILYFVTAENEYINHQNVLKFRKVEDRRN